MLKRQHHKPTIVQNPAVRPYLPERDVQSCLNLDCECFQDSYRGFWDCYWRGTVAASGAYGCDKIFVIQSNSQTIGLAIASYARRPGVLNIDRICVSPEKRRLGVARELINYILFRAAADWFSVVKKLSCAVPEENLEAQLFFKGIGWTCKEIVPDHYLMAENQTAYLFEIDVDPAVHSQLCPAQGLKRKM